MASLVSSQTTRLSRLTMFFVVVLPFCALVGGVYQVWGWGVDVSLLLLLLIFHCIAGLGITIGFHRHFTHRSFKTTNFIRLILGACGSMAMQGSVKAWVLTHRTHHLHSDEEGDPHSPYRQGLVHAHFGWLFSMWPAGDRKNISDLDNDPVVTFIDRTDWLWLILGFILPAAIEGMLSWSWTGFLLGAIWGGAIRIFFGQHITWSINSVCHVWGKRRFNTADESRNNWIFGFLGFGEGWHNNHHARQFWARHGIGRGEIDFSWYVIWALKRLGLAWDVKVPSLRNIAKVRRELARP